MIADALRLEIEKHAARVLEHNRFLDLARAGTVKPESIGRYLAAVRYMIGHTQCNLDGARRRAVEEGRHELAAFYLDKGREETGHERWAEDDLAAFESHFDIRVETVPVPAIVELQRTLAETIARDSLLYLSYVLWAEYFLVLAGGEFVRFLVQRCALPLSALTCITQHLVLDEGHVDEGIEAIDRLACDPRYLGPMRAALRRTMELFDLATDQMLHVPRGVERVAS